MPITVGITTTVTMTVTNYDNNSHSNPSRNEPKVGHSKMDVSRDGQAGRCGKLSQAGWQVGCGGIFSNKIRDTWRYTWVFDIDQ